MEIPLLRTEVKDKTESYQLEGQKSGCGAELEMSDSRDGVISTQGVGQEERCFSSSSSVSMDV